MSRDRVAAVVLDTMAVSALVNATRNPQRAVAYRRTIAAAPIVVSFVTVTELRYGVFADLVSTTESSLRRDRHVFRNRVAQRYRCSRSVSLLAWVVTLVVPAPMCACLLSRCFAGLNYIRSWPAKRPSRRSYSSRCSTRTDMSVGRIGPQTVSIARSCSER